MCPEIPSGTARALRKLRGSEACTARRHHRVFNKRGRDGVTCAAFSTTGLPPHGNGALEFVVDAHSRSILTWIWLIVTVTAAALSVSAQTAAGGPQLPAISGRPNIVVIALDDVGFSDLSVGHSDPAAASRL